MILRPNPTLMPPASFLNTVRPNSKPLKVFGSARAFPVPHVSFVGSVFVITGQFSQYAVREIKQFFSQHKGQLHVLVSPVTRYLIVGERDPSQQDPRKLALARAHQITIIEEKRLFSDRTCTWYTVPPVIPVHTPAFARSAERECTQLWTEKHRPATEADLITATPSQLAPIKQFLSEWKALKPKHSAILLMGPPGIGKTSAVYALAHDMHFLVHEWNASSERSKTVLDTHLRGMIMPLPKHGASKFTPERSMNRAMQRSMSPAEPILLLMEEVDGICGKEDSGGMQFLTRLLGCSTVPIIMTANDRGRLARTSLLQNPAVVCIVWEAPPPLVVLHRLRETVGRREHIPEHVFQYSLDWKRVLQSGDIRKAVQQLEALADGQTPFLYSVDSDPNNMFEVARHLFMNDRGLCARLKLTANTTDNLTFLARVMAGSFPLMIGVVPWTSDVRCSRETLVIREKVKEEIVSGGVKRIVTRVAPNSKRVATRMVLTDTVLTHEYFQSQKSVTFAPEQTHSTVATHHEVADYLSLADTVLTAIHSQQQNELYELYAWFACVAPSYAAERHARSVVGFEPQVRLDQSDGTATTRKKKPTEEDEEEEVDVGIAQIEQTWSRLHVGAATPVRQALRDFSYDLATWISKNEKSDGKRTEQKIEGSDRYAVSLEALGYVISDETVKASTVTTSHVKKRKKSPAAKRAPAKKKAAAAAAKPRPSVKRQK